MSDSTDHHRLIEEEQPKDPRYRLTEEGKLIPHRPDDQEFELNFDG